MTIEKHGESLPQDQTLELGLKHKSEFELYNELLDCTLSWPQDRQEQFWQAAEIVRMAHRTDRHKNTPYMYHLLRTANRIVQYLHVTDPDVVIAAVLHDVVEDHPMKVVAFIEMRDEYIEDTDAEMLLSPRVKQETAINLLESAFSPGVARIVYAVTNAPSNEVPQDYEEKLYSYASKVKVAIEDLDAWLVKFSDWCDNGVGIHYDAENRSPERTVHFQRKYGMVLPILEERFERDDIQAYLNIEAKEYARRQFQRGRERLILENA